MKEVNIKIENELGLHLRPAGLFVKEASKFDCEIFIEYQGNRVNSKSIMGILSLAIDCGAEIKIIAEGKDENEAVESMINLIKSKFGEN